MNTRKIKAFTLSELLVVLLITVIVVGLAFSILRLVQKQMNGISENFSAKTEKELFKQALWRDMNTFSRIYFDQETNELSCESALKQIKYQFDDNFIIRDQQDTFDLTIKQKQLFFLGNAINTGEVDAVQLKWTDSTQTPIMVYKTNAAESMMN